MARQVLSISVPANVLKWVRRRVAEDEEFHSVSDYIRELIRNDQERLKIKILIGPNFERILIPGTTFKKRLKTLLSAFCRIKSRRL
ncbi:MAG: hypothetical protein ABL959_12200 [Pyrinomonadaceae bacterium]